MTRNHRRKKAIREQAAATGRSYLDAAGSLTEQTPTETGALERVVLAEPLRDALAEGLTAAGWPVEIEYNPQASGLRCYAGPATVEVARVQFPVEGLTGDEHPDDAAVFDLASPLRVTVWAPLIVGFDPDLHRVGGLDGHDIPAAQSAAAITAQIDLAVGAARRTDLHQTPERGQCGICGDRYPDPALLAATTGPIRVCPCCVFDGDLLGVDPAYLAYQIDQATARSLVLPAGWSAVQTLLCCLGGPGLPQRLRSEWRDAGTLFEPSGVWADPAQVWIWLPPAGVRRPAALSQLGAGASLGTITAALNRAHPDLQARYQALRAEDLAEIRHDEDDDHEIEDHPGGEDRLQVPAETIERCWPAVLAYATAMITQRGERPEHRDPWHVPESFELDELVRGLDPNLDSFHIETVLMAGIPAVLEVLDPPQAPS